MHEPSADDSVKSKQTDLLGLQFGLRHLLFAMVLVSIACAILFTVPNWLVSASAVVGATLSALVFTSGVVYGCGNTRAFCIGVLFSLGLVIIAMACLFVVITFKFHGGSDGIFGYLDRYASGMRFASVFGSLLTPVAGVLSVLVRRFLRNRN